MEDFVRKDRWSMDWLKIPLSVKYTTYVFPHLPFLCLNSTEIMLGLVSLLESTEHRWKWSAQILATGIQYLPTLTTLPKRAKFSWLEIDGKVFAIAVV